MKLSKLSLFFVFSATLLTAQKQKYTMEEAVSGLRSNLAVENISQFSFSSDSKSYLSAVKSGYMITDFGTLKSDTLISLSRVNQNLQGKDRLDRLPPLSFLSSTSAYYKDAGQYSLLTKTSKGWTRSTYFKVPEKAENITVLEGKNAAVYTVDQNLYYVKGQEVRAISQSTDPNVVYGQAVHRNEFGIDRGIFVSPDQQKIAFYRMDQTMVADYPIVDWSGSPAKNENMKYPMAGQKSHEVTLGVYDINTSKITYLNIPGDKEQYLTAVTWSPDSKSIFVGVLNRDQNHLKMNQYSLAGAFVKEVFEEKSAQYVEPQHPLAFFPGSNTDFIWQSERSGYNHMYHYNVDKGLVGALTQGDFIITELLGFNERKNEIYYSSTEKSPLERQLYRLNYKTRKVEQLTHQPGMHSGKLSADGALLYDSYSNSETPRVVSVLRTADLKTHVLVKSKNPLENYERPEIRNITLNAEDGTPLYGKLILPTQFDPSKKYPVIVYLYNGPHLQLVTNSFPASGNLWYEYMAQNGYIVFTMDGRGSSNRGAKFERAVFRNLGEVEMKDQLKGVEFLKTIPQVDQQRMGVHGWSFGGFMTTNLMLSYPDVFKVGVAGGPVIDWNWYEIMYTERYMDSPSQNPEGYKKANLTSKVQNLKGDLLMIHGAQDDVVLWQHSIKFLKAAVDKGIQLDYFVYPGHKHNVLGKDRVHLMQKVTDYFDLHLKGEKK
ncbi:S9 family peptidase [Chryseobacterium sp. A321]